MDLTCRRGGRERASRPPEKAKQYHHKDLNADGLLPVSASFPTYEDQTQPAVPSHGLLSVTFLTTFMTGTTSGIDDQGSPHAEEQKQKDVNAFKAESRHAKLLAQQFDSCGYVGAQRRHSPSEESLNIQLGYKCHRFFVH